MAVSRTQICNMALSNANQEGVLMDVDTEQSNEADRCRQWYDISRLVVLAAYDWSFARKRADLVVHADDPPSDFNDFLPRFRYQYPNDCIAIRNIKPYDAYGRQRPFSVESAPNSTRSIVCAIDEAVMQYTFDNVDTFQFPPNVAIAISLVIGSYIVGPTTGRNNLKRDLIVQANLAVREAAAIDLNTEQDEPERDAEWIQAREGYGSIDPFLRPRYAEDISIFIDARNRG